MWDCSYGSNSHTRPSRSLSSRWMSFPVPPQSSKAYCASACEEKSEQLYALRVQSYSLLGMNSERDAATEGVGISMQVSAAHNPFFSPRATTSAALKSA